MLNPHGMASGYRVPPGSPFLSLQIKNSKRSHVIWIHPPWLRWPSGLSGAPKMRGSNGELTSPTTYPPHAVPFQFGRRAAPNWSKLRHSFPTACVPSSNRLNMTTSTAAALSAVSDRDWR